jgi:Protein of unknown function (DUF2937)
VDWFIDKFDRLLTGLCIAAFALAAAQISPFAAQYMARSAADLRAAQAHVADVQTGLRYQTMAEQVRGELLSEANQTLARAQTAHDALAQTTPLLHPLALWRWVDPAIRDATWADFVPAVPGSAWSMVLTVLGALIGLAVYEAVKWPVVALVRAPRRRFKKRGLI